MKGVILVPLVTSSIGDSEIIIHFQEARNQSTIISLDWLNTFRIYFRTNSSLVHWCVRKQV